MRNTVFSACPAVLLWLCLTPALATSYLPMTDRQLLDQAEVVVSGVVETVDDLRRHDRGRGYSRYRVQVERALKGRPGERIVVRVPGNYDLGRGGTWVLGAPRFAPGQRLLLFLNRRSGQEYGVSQLMLGAFYEYIDADNNRLAVRDLSNTRTLGRMKTTERFGSRHFDRFADWVAGRQAKRQNRSAVEPAADYWLDDDTGNAAKFVLRTPAARWTVFDGGGELAWRSLVGGQPGMAGGGIDKFRDALAAWTDDVGSRVRFSYAGTTNQTSVADGENIILFDDPNDEISGSFDGRGTIAVNFIDFSGDSHLYNGKSYRRILSNRIITQDGAGDFLAGNGGANGAETFAHELGHALGLGHSCGDTGPCDTVAKDEAIMRASAHADGRGAQLSLDDRAGVAALYAESGIDLVPPTDVAASDGVFPDRVQLTWTGVSGASSYQVWRGRGNDSAAATLLADRLIASEYFDTDVIPDQSNFYWIKAQNGDQTSAFSAADSGFSTVNPQCEKPLMTLLSPEPDETLANDRITFRWAPANATTEYHLELSKFPDFEPKLPISTGATSYTTIPKVQPGDHYWRLRGRNLGNGCDFFGDWSETRFYFVAQPGDTQPTLTVATPAASQTVPAAQSSFVFAGTAADANGGSIARVQYRLNGADWQTASGAENWSFTVAALAPGRNGVEVRAQDNSDIYSPVALRTITRGDPPTLSVDQGNQTLPAGVTAVSFSGSATDPDGTVLEVEYRAGGGWTLAEGTENWQFTATGLTPGVVAVEIRARDNDGIFSEVVPRSVTVTAAQESIFVDQFD